MIGATLYPTVSCPGWELPCTPIHIPALGMCCGCRRLQRGAAGALLTPCTHSNEQTLLQSRILPVNKGHHGPKSAWGREWAANRPGQVRASKPSLTARFSRPVSSFTLKPLCPSPPGQPGPLPGQAQDINHLSCSDTGRRNSPSWKRAGLH